MVNVLLWTLLLVGCWNAINMLCRIYYRDDPYKYAFHVFIGAWAGVIIWMTPS